MKSNNHIKTGKEGEAFALEFLTRKNYNIVERNYRAGRCEIDLIVRAPDGTMVFVEVKTRSSYRFGGPEAAISRKKQDKIMRAAGAWMEQTGYNWAIRFDTVAVIVQNGRLKQIRHHEDAFFL